MANNYSGKEWQVVLAKKDQSASAIGTATNGFVASSNVFFRVSAVNDFDFSAGFQTAEVQRAGRRAMTDEDMISHYGSGTWTWAFDYLVENETAIQNLLSLIYGGATVTTALTVPADPVITDLSHGKQGATDTTAEILLLASTVADIADEDKRMHSAILTELTLACDSGSDGGRLKATGNFMSGYKPVISDSGLTGVTTATDYEKSIFDMGTLTIGGTAVTVKSFSVTLSNPAQRVGFQGTAGEADGYTQGSEFAITGTVTVKYDGATADLLDTWISGAGSSVAILFEEGASFSISIPSARFTGHNIDYASEGGMFVEIPFKATSGADGATNLAVIKCT